ncbi:MAG TPA: elongation factor 3, partial [Hyphomonas sp.]|nr:elongation factor 3 [Hyphomonas sp.]
PKPQKKLSYKDEHRQKEINALIPKLQAEIKTLEAKMGDPELYTRDPDAFAKASARIGAARDEIDMIEMEWLEIEEKRESLSGA